ncbi:unnamed protein product [Linum tenue]|uniref:Uncharacterized protein n=1 Tax=Linum tenue TaxID=586396 RepID=A0AAV0GUA9_9ROSI|nr:unnamed protein product [Linum tenue]
MPSSCILSCASQLAGLEQGRELHFGGHEGTRYTRDQLLEFKQDVSSLIFDKMCWSPNFVPWLLGQECKTCPAEENVEAICQFFNTIGKQLDEIPKSQLVNDISFSRFKELANLLLDRCGSWSEMLSI